MSLFFILNASFLDGKAVFIIAVLPKLKIRQEKWDILALIGQIKKQTIWRREKPNRFEQ